ncbi:hypothetical protein ABFY54_28780 [Priestia megaterium]|uniref:hypothetical protein n=1 Tax=Priestia megaterium TaxID=1404 RepID=UPI003D2BC8B0
MKANEVKEMLSDNDIMSLLQDLGAEPMAQGSNIVCRTICHHGNKKKLIYFTDSKSFRCFTDQCGSMSIFDLVGRVMNLDFYNSFKYVCMKFGINYRGVASTSEVVDTSFIKKFKERKQIITINNLPKNILNTYYDLYHKTWVNDGISIRSMKKFGIKFSIADNQIIIPHFDIDNNLIGVRARNLKQEIVDEGKKYMPVFYKDRVLKHPTGAALYGLNLTREKAEEYRAIILFESEKSVLQLDTMFPDMSIGACISGSSLTTHQLEILKSLDIDEVIVATDKEFEEVGSQEDKFYREKIGSVFLDKLRPYFRTSVIWDTEGLLELKDSPTDKGPEVFTKLFENRFRF